MASTFVLIAVASKVISSGGIILGGVVSTTLISWVPVVTFLFASVAVHVTMVLPRGYSLMPLFDILTLNMSVAVACPISTGVFMAVASDILLSGTFKTGGVLSVTVMFWVPVVELPFASVAVQVTFVVPTEKPSLGASLVTVTANMSLASASPRFTIVFSASASTVLSFGTVRLGLVVSTIVIFCIFESSLLCSSMAVQVTKVSPRE